MTLKVYTPKEIQEFDGPYGSTDQLRDNSGVYVITTKMADNKHKVLDVGESAKVRERVANHDRADCWPRFVQNGIYYSAHYCDGSKRMSVQDQIREAHDPPCGKK